LYQSVAGGTVEIHFDSGEAPKDILVGSSLLSDEAGNPQEIILNLHNITELKKLEYRVRQVERMAALGTLAAGLSHEIRNPLSAIKTFVQLLPRKIEKPGFMERFHRTVPREINRINQLIESLLDLARPPKYQFASTNIGSLLTETIDFMEVALQTYNIRCLRKLPTDLPHIWADSGQLIKAFQNLIQNAAQAMPSGGALTIEACFEEEDPLFRPTTEKRNGSVTVSFQDSGPGMTQEVLKNIFNPFFTTKDTGTGLGLAITHKVITEHGGRIEVTSEEGKGTRFTVDLPIQE
jgi:two-component system sensor histidine kinase AtoS